MFEPKQCELYRPAVGNGSQCLLLGLPRLGTAFLVALGSGKYCVVNWENDLSAVNSWLEMWRGVSIR